MGPRSECDGEVATEGPVRGPVRWQRGAQANACLATIAHPHIEHGTSGVAHLARCCIQV